MKVSILQFDIAWGETGRNLTRLREAFGKCPGSDLYILPEMFTTGFATQPDSKVDDTPELTTAWMKEQARDGDCAIAGSIAVKDGDSYFNRFLFVTPDGAVATYDKRHLFTYGGERIRFSPGSKRVVVEFRGVKFLLEVCYDLRFPVWSRNRGDYDAAIYVANWPVVRQDAWDTLVKARAIENQCFLLAANRCGHDPVCDYLGGSAIINPYGQILSRAVDYAEEWVTADIDMPMLESYRAKFPVLEDADPFELV